MFQQLLTLMRVIIRERKCSVKGRILTESQILQAAYFES